jgi:hypothetical protein
VRDEWESKKPDFEAKISKALGETWTVTTNPHLLYVYTDDESYKSRIGDIITWYVPCLLALTLICPAENLALGTSSRSAPTWNPS